jgi:hypothetical protein
MKTSFVNKNGTFPRDESSKISDYMHRTKGKFIRIEFTAVKNTRSLLQNAYYWSVIIAMLSDEIGYEPDLMHEIVKKMFLSTRSYPMPSCVEEIKLVKSTTDLDTVGFEEYVLSIRVWAKDFLSMDIPLPNQTNYNYYEVT